MIKKRILTLFMALFLLPALTWADTFSSMGTRWPSGLKKTLVGNHSTLFAANGDVVAAYEKDTMVCIDQITLNAPDGIVAIDHMKIEAGAGLPDNEFIVVACGTGGLQVIPFADGKFSSIDAGAVVIQSDTARANENTPAALDIKGCVSFKAHSENLIATIDDNFGYRVFHFNQSTPTLDEVAQQELSEEAFTMLVDLDRWDKDPTSDCILTVAKNRELGLLDMAKDPLGKWSITGLGKAIIDLPNLPSTELLYFSSLTLRVSGDVAHVIENSMGFYFSFAISDDTPFLMQTYPQPDTDGVSFGYPLDLAVDGPHTYITTLMEKDDNIPGVQVMELSSKAVVGTLAQDGAGALHKNGEHLFLMDLKNGLSKIDTSSKTSPTRIDNPEPTPFAAHALLARQTYLYLADGLASPKSGFRIMDISNAAQPKRIRFEATPGNAQDIAVDGDFYRLFIADGDEGVRCYSMNGSFVTEDFDLTSPVPSPEAPLCLETLSSDQFDGESVLKVSVSSKNINRVNVDFLHVLSANGKLFSFPLPVAESNPIHHVIDTAKKVTFGGLVGTPVSMDPFLHDYLLVAAGEQGLQVVDLFSDANTPGTLTPAIEASYVNGLSQTVSVSSDDSRYAYVADNSGGIVAFDLFSDPNTPALINLSMVGNYPLATGHFLDIFVTDNNNAYTITDQTYGNIRILDVSTPSAITLLGSETTLGAPRAVIAATTGGLSPDTPALRAAYVADGQGGLSIRQTTNDDNSQEQTWSDDSTSCFINATH